MTNLSSLIFTILLISTATSAYASVDPHFCELAFDSSPAGPRGFLSPLTRYAGGSTGGRWYSDQAGIQWFVKKDVRHPELQTSAEVISSKIYQFFGYSTPRTFKFTVGETYYSAAKEVAQPSISTNFVNMQSPEIRRMRFVAAYLKDWDRLGNSSNNRLGDDGKLTILDFGGTLGSRARGSHKPGLVFSPAIGSFEATDDIRVIYDSFESSKESIHPWNQVTKADAIAVIERFRQLDDHLIADTVDEAKYSQPEDRAYMIKALTLRRDGMIHSLAQRFRETHHGE